MRLYSASENETTYFGFAWNRCDSADLALLQSIDKAALANIGISNKTDRNLFFIGVKLGELPQECD